MAGKVKRWNGLRGEKGIRCKEIETDIREKREQERNTNGNSKQK